MAVRTSAITVSAMAALLTLSGQAFAGYSMSGDAASLTVVADNAPRNEVIAGITDRLSVQRKGAALPEDLVSGVFTGNLSQVLNAILPHNGFVVA